MTACCTRRRPAARHTEAVPAAVAALQQKTREAAKARTTNGAVDVSSLVSRAGQVDGAIVLTEVVEAIDAKALLDLADRVKGKLGESAAVVLAARWTAASISWRASRRRSSSAG